MGILTVIIIDYKRLIDSINQAEIFQRFPALSCQVYVVYQDVVFSSMELYFHFNLKKMHFRSELFKQ